MQVGNAGCSVVIAITVFALDDTPRDERYTVEEFILQTIVRRGDRVARSHARRAHL
jgi:hypothetical protein